MIDTPVAHSVRRLLLRPDVLGFLACAIVFTAWPGLDLAVAGEFYVPGHGFPLDDTWPIQALYRIFQYIGWVVVLAAIGGWIAARAGRVRRPEATRRACVYLLLVALIGPLLLVNGVLKEHWGRARPHEVTQFGGQHTFTPALEPANQCDSNCSFVSGHAAAGFYFMALAWAFRRRRWLYGGLGLGALAGFTRIAQGGHFLSDVVFSGWCVYATCLLVAWLLYRDTRIERPPPNPPDDTT